MKTIEELANNKNLDLKSLVFDGQRNFKKWKVIPISRLRMTEIIKILLIV